MNKLYHFIFNSEENKNDLPFINYISVYSAYLINNPDIIYFYYDSELRGKWWERLKLIPNFLKTIESSLFKFSYLIIFDM